MNQTLIKIKNLNFSLDGISILENINFYVEQGDYLAILGPNGSGKTTLMKLITGATELSYEGNIDFFKMDRTQIGYLPQLIVSLEKRFPATVQEIVMTGLLGKERFSIFSNQKCKKKVNEILTELEILHLRDKNITELSGGQRQRVLFARSLVSNPLLLILDEPTSALDPMIRKDFYSLIKKLNEEKGVTILLVSHDIESVLNNCDKILYLDKSILFFDKCEKFGGI
jgi:zinc transport system ATP-binding protein